MRNTAPAFREPTTCKAAVQSSHIFAIVETLGGQRAGYNRRVFGEDIEHAPRCLSELYAQYIAPLTSFMTGHQHGLGKPCKEADTTKD